MCMFCNVRHFALGFSALSWCFHQEIEVHLHSCAFIILSSDLKMFSESQFSVASSFLFKWDDYLFLNTLMILSNRFQNFCVFLKHFLSAFQNTAYFRKKEKSHHRAKMSVDKTSFWQNAMGIILHNRDKISLQNCHLDKTSDSQNTT